MILCAVVIIGGFWLQDRLDQQRTDQCRIASAHVAVLAAQLAELPEPDLAAVTAVGAAQRDLAATCG